MISFIFISIIGALYFLLKKRKFDFFSIGYFSSFLYFLPGFFDRVSFTSNFVRYEEKMIDETYYVFNIVLSSIVISAILFDSFKLNRNKQIVKTSKDYFAGEICLILALCSLIILIRTAGFELLNPNKLYLMSKLDRWMMLLNYSSSFAFIILYYNKQRILFVLALLTQISILIIGFRFPLVISIIGAFCINFMGKEPFRLIKFKKYFIYAIFFTIFTLLIKRFLVAIKMWDVDLIISLANDSDYLLTAFTNAEPFETQSILNKVIQTNFEVPLDHLDQFLAFFLFESSYFDIEIRSFNSYFQSVLFPGVRFGMASNIWAQFYALGGWVGLLLFVIIFNFVIIVLNNLVINKTRIFSVVFILAGIYWSFYMQRNDLAYILSTQKKIFLFGVFISILNHFYNFLRK